MAVNTEAVNNETVKNKKTSCEEKREKVFIPKGYATEEPNLFVSVNGVNYLLPRGKESEVPAHVAYEVKRSLRAQEKQDENIERLLSESK